MDSIIVYRNPLEAAVWNVLMNHGHLVVGFIVVFFLVFATSRSLALKVLRNKKIHWMQAIASADKISLVIAIISAGMFIVGVTP